MERAAKGHTLPAAPAGAPSEELPQDPSAAGTQDADDLQPWLDDHDDTLASEDQVLASLRYESGLRLVFTYDDSSEDYGLNQRGYLSEAHSLTLDTTESLLSPFLAITPATTPVPDRLLAEPDPDVALSARLQTRKPLLRSSKRIGTIRYLFRQLIETLRCLHASCDRWVQARPRGTRCCKCQRRTTRG